ncbi:MAG: VWA domain-containing protein [Nitrospiraceae bacterium]|nr:VWA domain-containing protein [Nitrospiraceae bacterium]
MKIGFAFPLRQLHLWLGLAGVALALIVLGLYLLEKQRRARLTRFVDAGLAPRLLWGYSVSVRRPLFWLTVFGFAALALTFAQPRWGQAWEEVRQQSHDVLVCLDTSESMRAANPLPTRLDRAKQKILSLLELGAGDRFGFLAFSGAAALQSPLTHDHGYFKSVLNVVDTDTISAEGTNIAAALKEAIEVFRTEAETTGVIDNNSRAVLLISDGEQVSGDAVAAAEEVSEYARVYVIGVGDPNGAEIRLPDWMGRYVKVRDGERPHLSRLDEETLQKVALAGKGAYIRSTPDNTDVNKIHEHIESLTAYTSSSDVRLRLVNRYQWPLALAILCFMAEGVWIALMPWVRSWRMRREPEESTAWNLPEAMEEENRG